MDAYQLITSAYSQVAGIATVQNLGSALLGLALAAWMLYELYRFLVAGQADFMTPILKVGGAILVLQAIVPIGDLLSSGMRELSDRVFDQNVAELATRAWTAAFEGVEDRGVMDKIEALFTPTFWMMAATNLELMAVVVIKVCIIDVLWPVMLALVLFAGVLTVPIGIFPGVNSAKGWFMNVVEVAIWPLVFQLVTTLLFACFAGQLARMEELRDVWKQVDKLEAQSADSWDEEESAQLQSQADSLAGEDGKLKTLFKFLAINTAFMFLTLYTPALARKIVQSESAGYVGGAMVAVGTGAVQGLRGRLGNLASDLGRQGGSRGGGGGGGETKGSTPSADKPQEQRLDERKAG